MSKASKILAVLALLVASSLPGMAYAHGHGHGGTHVSLGFGFGYPAYYPAPVYYYPPPPVYYPPPAVVYTPPPAPAPASNCRTFNGDATIDASGQPFYGTACYGADSRWHITN